MHELCLTIEPDVVAVEFCLTAVVDATAGVGWDGVGRAADVIGGTAGAAAVDDVTAVDTDAFDVVALAIPKFFSEPMEPFSRSGLSTSGPPNSCNCCSQQQSMASMPSSTCDVAHQPVCLR